MTAHRLPDDAGPMWRDLVGRRGIAMIFKHSPLCGLSAVAPTQVRWLPTLHPDLPIRQVDVVGQRGLSQQIAEDLGIRHESPQAILLVDGSMVWAGSQHGVNQAAVLETVDRDRDCRTCPRRGWFSLAAVTPISWCLRRSPNTRGRARVSPCSPRPMSMRTRE